MRFLDYECPLLQAIRSCPPHRLPVARSRDASQSPITPLGAILDLKTGKNLIRRPTALSHNIERCRTAFPHNQDPMQSLRKFRRMQLMHLTICLELGQAGDPQRQDHPPGQRASIRSESGVRKRSVAFGSPWSILGRPLRSERSPHRKKCTASDRLSKSLWQSLLLRL